MDSIETVDSLDSLKVLSPLSSPSLSKKSVPTPYDIVKAQKRTVFHNFSFLN